MIPAPIEQLLYLVAAVLFILGLKRLSRPDTAHAGNRLSGLGMLLAIGVTLLDRGIVSYTVIAAGLVVGGLVGFWMARAVKMTSMPQMVALLNGCGGAASLVVAGGEFLRAELLGLEVPLGASISIQLALLIGAVTFTGSLVAWGKLQEVVTGRPVTFAGQRAVNALLFLVVVGLSVYQIATVETLLWPFYAVTAASLLLGVMLVIPIGGADMPVVISLLNSYSGLAAAMTGFVIGNSVLVIAGALVGSSGIILSQIMCKAMNRSLANVLFGALGSAPAGGSGRSSEGLVARPIQAEDLAVQLAYAQKVGIIPGYGLAVAQAQHQVRELAELIEKSGGEVRYMIHPVAGRMPGHMNVLLAEANVPYEQMITEVEEANAFLAQADIALVIGANDIVNPAALEDPGSPIYGMPILRADSARRSVVMKRSMASGFAGVENDLFYRDNNNMLFGNAKDSLQALIAEVKQELAAGV